MEIDFYKKKDQPCLSVLILNLKSSRKKEKFKTGNFLFLSKFLCPEKSSCGQIPVFR